MSKVQQPGRGYPRRSAPARFRRLVVHGESSGGKFLYAAFVLNELASEALPLRDRADLEALPAGMDDFYLQAFERRFPSEQVYDQVRELLALQCVQRDPLSRRELAAILNWEQRFGPCPAM